MNGTTTTQKRTEAEMLGLLRERHCRSGNGGSGEYAFMTHVRNSAGFDSTRTIDAIVMSLWPSRGLMLHAFEVKCSRSDWQRELKQPKKADDIARLVDRFSIVAADMQIVATGELPPTWGLLVATGNKLACVRDAPLLPNADPKRPIKRDFLVALLRAGGAVPKAEPAEVAAARLEGRKEGEEFARKSADGWKERYEEAQKKINDFERESGMALGGWRSVGDPAQLGAAVRSILAGEARVDQAQGLLRRVQGELRSAADGLDRFLGDG